MMPALTALPYSSRAKSKGRPSKALMDGVMALVEREAIAVFCGGLRHCATLPAARLGAQKNLARLSTSRIRRSRS
jgi:hypothetical protein